jgi:hypothetical protein
MFWHRVTDEIIFTVTWRRRGWLSQISSGYCRFSEQLTGAARSGRQSCWVMKQLQREYDLLIYFRGLECVELYLHVSHIFATVVFSPAIYHPVFLREFPQFFQKILRLYLEKRLVSFKKFSIHVVILNIIVIRRDAGKRGIHLWKRRNW